MAENDNFTNQPVSYGNLRRLLKQTSSFGQSFDDVLGVVLTKVESWEARSAAIMEAGARLDEAAAAMDSVAAMNPIGAPHGPAGLLAVNTGRPGTASYRIGRNVMLPIGMTLRGQFRGQSFEAVVTPAGIGVVGEFFETPTAAAVAVKVKLNIERKAAQTNGWLFWSYEESPGVWYPLARLRQHQTGEQGDEEE